MKMMILAAAVLMGTTIMAANAVTYLPPQAPATNAAHDIHLVKSGGTPPVCSEAAIQVACLKRPYDSCAADYRRIHNC